MFTDRERAREQERQTDSLTAWKSVQEKSAREGERVNVVVLSDILWYDLCVGNMLPMLAWQLVLEKLSTRTAVNMYTHTCTCMRAIVAERDFSNRFTLTFDARCLFARICCCCYAKLGFILLNDVTAHWQHCKTSLFLFWFSDMATAAWLSNDLVACFFFGATLRPCQCVDAVGHSNGVTNTYVHSIYMYVYRNINMLCACKERTFKA